jgi:hypothetical protein
MFDKNLYDRSIYDRGVSSDGIKGSILSMSRMNFDVRSHVSRIRTRVRCEWAPVPTLA